MTQNNIPQYYDVSANILLFTMFNKENVHYIISYFGNKNMGKNSPEFLF